MRTSLKTFRVSSSFYKPLRYFNTLIPTLTTATTANTNISQGNDQSCGSSCGCTNNQANTKESFLSTFTSPPPLEPKLSIGEQELQLLINQVITHHKLGQFEQALEAAEKSATLAEKLYGIRHPVYASSLNNMALMQKNLLNMEEALNTYRKALNIYEDTVGKSSMPTLVCMNNIAICHRMLGQYDEAERLLNKVIGTFDEIQKTMDIVLATSLSNLGMVYSQQHQKDEKAQQENSVSPVSSDLAEARARKSMSCHKRAVQIVKRYYGDEHPQTASMLNNMAFSFKCVGQYEPAIQHYQEALGIRTRNLPEGHPDIIVSVHNLAECLQASGKEENANNLRQYLLELIDKYAKNQS